MPGFLENLPGNCGRGRVPGIGPATRQRPPAVGLLAHQQRTFLIVEDRATYVDLRRGVAAITTELGSELVSRPAAEHREQLGRQLAHLLIPVQVVVASGVRQPVLSERSKPDPDPAEPRPQLSWSPGHYRLRLHRGTAPSTGRHRRRASADGKSPCQGRWLRHEAKESPSAAAYLAHRCRGSIVTFDPRHHAERRPRSGRTRTVPPYWAVEASRGSVSSLGQNGMFCAGSCLSLSFPESVGGGLGLWVVQDRPARPSGRGQPGRGQCGHAGAQPRRAWRGLEAGSCWAAASPLLTGPLGLSAVGSPVTGFWQPPVPRLRCGSFAQPGWGASEDVLSGLGHRRAPFRSPAQRNRAALGRRDQRIPAAG